ncbi:Inosine-uridine nucleoside N-ribohydrolase [Halogranum rubrum]|uniref:Inosine-uridine nucleoside N-ribohydrolase n=1 Tax=Halogranum rubrum TaxID=553466 RepID=A0A1I4E1P8_9EURY|nr:nucleoside hydrolase [Halogranum rubrum]SFK99788.1 Inosine-uridine nucleoside N-ribohydrolase [Halogranum rubrum]
MAEKLLLDVDPGLDDSIALLMAFGSDAVDVVGVTSVMGNTELEHTTENARSLVGFARASDVPVAAGAARPFCDTLVDAEYVHGPSGIPDVARQHLPDRKAELSDSGAAEFIVEQAREHGDDLTIAALGPQTNLALALAVEPRVADWVGDIYQMGGALTATGNITPAASFNFYADPAAAARVVQDASPRMVGLDVTEQAYVPRSDFDRFDEGTAVGAFVGAALEYKSKDPDSGYDIDGAFTSDAVVVADIVDDVLDYEDAYVDIDTSGGPSHGASVYDEHGVLEREPNCSVAVDIDVDRCRQVVYDSLDAAERLAE